jgi:uncharacterized protein (DUF2235 family)
VATAFEEQARPRYAPPAEAIGLALFVRAVLHVDQAAATLRSVAAAARESAVAKNIVICSDGTGNTTITGRGTNVFKLFEAVDVNGHQWDPALTPQVTFYDDGVGTESIKPLRLLGGAAGWGLSRNIRQLYKELARVYDPGDQIYMFGFSRGAFTVRSLVGMIGRTGLIDVRKAPTAAALDALVTKAYATYRSCYRTTLSRWIRRTPQRDAGAAFRQAFSREEHTPIRFVGVWDTVDGVGLPFHLSDIINSVIYRFKFPDHFLSEQVREACHALSIDDERHSFEPLLWNECDNDGRIEQVWFAGVHSNVGGGYPKQGMSLVALDWMMAKAEVAGLRFNCRDREAYREHASVDDKLYDPRAGLGTFYRWKPRDIADICARNHIPARLHISAINRIAHGVEDYAPDNLPPQVTVVTTRPYGNQDPALIEQRAANAERVYTDAFNGASLLDSLTGTVAIGRLSYYVFLLACTAALLGVVIYGAVDRSALGIGRQLASLVGGALSSPIDTGIHAATILLSHRPLLLAVVLALLMSSVMSRFADRRISNVASAFWHEHRPRLRQALKDARSIALADAAATSAPLCWGSAAYAALHRVGERQQR